MSSPPDDCREADCQQLIDCEPSRKATKWLPAYQTMGSERLASGVLGREKRHEQLSSTSESPPYLYEYLRKWKYIWMADDEMGLEWPPSIGTTDSGSSSPPSWHISVSYAPQVTMGRPTGVPDRIWGACYGGCHPWLVSPLLLEASA